MNVPRLAILLALIVCLNAQAGAPRLDDFAYRVNVAAQPGLNALELNEAILRAARTANLLDLRVFNGAGEALPMAPLRLPDVAPGPASELRTVPLPAQTKARDKVLSDFALRIERLGAGAVIELTTADPVSAPGEAVGGYLLDLRLHENMDGEIRLQFARDADDYSGRIDLLGSDDLVAWRPLASGSLVRNRQLGDTIERNSFPVGKLPPFVRVAWRDARAPQLGGAVFVARGAQPIWPRAVLAVTRGDSAESWLVAVPVGLPVARLHLRAPGDNVSMRVRVFRYDMREVDPPAQVHLHPRRAPQPWIDVGTHEVFRVYRDGKWVENSPFPLAHRTTRLRIDSVGGNVGDAPPIVEAEWQPQRYLVAVRAPAPYVLAVGSAESDPQPGPTLDPRSVLPDDAAGLRLPVARLEAAPAAAQPAEHALRGAHDAWLRYVLWGMLLLAVVALSLMAWRIAEQLRAQGRAD